MHIRTRVNKRNTSQTPAKVELWYSLYPVHLKGSLYNIPQNNMLCDSSMLRNTMKLTVVVLCHYKHHISHIQHIAYEHCMVLSVQLKAAVLTKSIF